MIIQKQDHGFIIKIYKEFLDDFDCFDKDSIQNLFQKILVRILEKYELKGLLDVNVYVNDDFGLIIEMSQIASYFDEIDMQIHFHIGTVFLSEIEYEDILSYKNVYYYQNKFYGVYQGITDSPILYKESSEIIEKGIKVY